MAEAIVDLLKMPNEMYDNQMVPGFVQGTVVENNNDDYPGMVKVSFTVWEDKKNMIEWVRLLSPYTGKDYGTYLVPEIDETVLVGFIGGSIKRPFLLGSLYPGDSKLVKEQYDKKNINKRIQTKGGISIALSDEENKQSVTVTTKKEIKLVLEDEKETVLISDKDGKNKIFLDMKNGAVSIEAEKTMTLKAGDAKLVLDGNKKQMDLSTGTINIAANQKLSMEGKTSTSVKGGSFEAAGTQSAKISASGQMEISGAMVKIN